MMLRANLLLTATLALQSTLFAQSGMSSKETNIVVFAYAFEDLELGTDKLVDLLNTAFILHNEELSISCVPKAYGLNETEFRKAFYNSINTLFLIEIGIPLEKAITVLKAVKSNQPYTKMTIVDFFAHALTSIGQRVNKNDLAVALHQSYALSMAGAESRIPFIAIGVDIESIPDAEISEVFFKESKEYQAIPFQGMLDKVLDKGLI